MDKGKEPPQYLVALTETELRLAYVAACEAQSLATFDGVAEGFEDLAAKFEGRLERIRLAEQAMSAESAA